MTPFEFRLPTRLFFGAGSIAQLGEVARDLGFARPLLGLDRPEMWFPVLGTAGSVTLASASDSHECKIGQRGYGTPKFSGLGRAGPP